MSRLLVLCAALLLLAAAPASAEITRKKSMWGPATVGGASQFPIYADLGVGIWQTGLRWEQVATRRPERPSDPTDPAYAWPAELDAAIADAQAHGIAVALLVMGTPAWANGGRSAKWAPNSPRDYARFLTAAAHRYPAVRHWIIWGEPTKNTNFQPLRKDRHRRLTGRGLRGPRIYARMLDRAYGALKAVSPANIVIGGNSFTVGTVTPRRWIQALRLPGGRPPRMDLYGHNPFSARRPVLSQDPLGRGFADFGDLDTLAGWLDRDLKGAGPAAAGSSCSCRRPRSRPITRTSSSTSGSAGRRRRTGSRTPCARRAPGRASTRSAISGSTTTRCGRTACRWSAG